MTIAEAFVPLAITTRSGREESVHFGAVVVVDASGAVLGALGDLDVAIYPRSSNKPLQAEAMLGVGFDPTPEQLALACASHDGTARHIEVVRTTLAAAGLDESALGNTADLPLDQPTAERLLAAGGVRTPIAMNCSGKHAAMVATCVANGWPVEGYLAPDHPLQRAITNGIEDLIGAPAPVGIDGCGAPAHVLTLAALARAFAAVAGLRGRVWSAMTTHPDLVGGTRRDVTRLMQAVPELMAKDGAEGVFAAALPAGVAVAVKIADGASRAAGVVIAAALEQAGVAIDPASLGEPVKGHGKPVGGVHPRLDGLL